MSQRFQISLRLRHPSADPVNVTRLLQLDPIFSWKSGDRAGEITHEASVWFGHLAQGSCADDYNEALEASVQKLEESNRWFNGFFKEEGRADLIFAYWTDQTEGMLCQTRFYPELLARLANLSVGMQVEVWMDESDHVPSPAL